jgi:hypothetical protein
MEMTTPSVPADDFIDRKAAANYVATLSGDLAVIARRHGLDTLGYLLEMAQLEAENASRYESNPDSS